MILMNPLQRLALITIKIVLRTSPSIIRTLPAVHIPQIVRIFGSLIAVTSTLINTIGFFPVLKILFVFRRFLIFLPFYSLTFLLRGRVFSMPF